MGNARPLKIEHVPYGTAVQLAGGAPRRTSGASIVRRVSALSHADFGGSAVFVDKHHALGLG